MGELVGMGGHKMVMAQDSDRPDVPLTSEWAGYQKLVLAEMSRHSQVLQELSRQVQEVNVAAVKALEARESIADFRRQLERVESGLRAEAEASEKGLQKQILDLMKEVGDREVAREGEISALKVKAGVWGVAGGLIVAVATILIAIAKKIIIP